MVFSVPPKGKGRSQHQWRRRQRGAEAVPGVAWDPGRGDGDRGGWPGRRRRLCGCRIHSSLTPGGSGMFRATEMWVTLAVGSVYQQVTWVSDMSPRGPLACYSDDSDIRFLRGTRSRTQCPVTCWAFPPCRIWFSRQLGVFTFPLHSFCSLGYQPYIQ